MPITKLAPTQAREAIQEWTEAVDALFYQVQEWTASAHPRDWQVSRSLSEVNEASLGGYSIPLLEINAAEGRLVLEPIGRDVFGAKGRIDLYAWPSLYRVLLLRSFADNDWVIRTESGINWPQPWGKEAFLTVAEELLRAL